MEQNYSDITLVTNEELEQLMQRLIEVFEPMRQAINDFWEQLPDETRQYIIATVEAREKTGTSDCLPPRKTKHSDFRRYRSKKFRRIHGSR